MFKKIILTHPNFDNLGGYLSKRLWIKKANVNFNKFPDLWPNYFIDNVKEDIEWADLIYIWDFSKPELVFENYTIIRGLLDYQVAKLNIIMPFFPVGTMERIDIKWEVATAKYYADIFSNIPSWTYWKTTIHIFDIHALATRFFFDSQHVNIDLHTAMNLIKNKIQNDTVIVFPDEWAKKRFDNDFNAYEKIVCSKKRIWDKREIVISEWNPKNKNVLIVDDLIQTWWTIIKTAELLRKTGANKVEAFATHGVFPNDSYLKLAENLDTLYTTNSIPDNAYKTSNIDNIKVLNISDIIEKFI